jgi:hypothetical protein
LLKNPKDSSSIAAWRESAGLDPPIRGSEWSPFEQIDEYTRRRGRPERPERPERRHDGNQLKVVEFQPHVFRMDKPLFYRHTVGGWCIAASVNAAIAAARCMQIKKVTKVTPNW